MLFNTDKSKIVHFGFHNKEAQYELGSRGVVHEKRFVRNYSRYVFLRPGVLGLTLNRAPPFAPPPRCHPLATTRRLGGAIPDKWRKYVHSVANSRIEDG